MSRIAALTMLLLAFRLQTQEDDPAARNRKNNFEWAVGLAGNFQRLHEPVVAAYAIAQLGGLADFQRLEASLAEIRDENLMAAQLNVLAALRLGR